MGFQTAMPELIFTNVFSYLAPFFLIFNATEYNASTDIVTFRPLYDNTLKGSDLVTLDVLSLLFPMHIQRCSPHSYIHTVRHRPDYPRAPNSTRGWRAGRGRHRSRIQSGRKFPSPKGFEITLSDNFDCNLEELELSKEEIVEAHNSRPVTVWSPHPSKQYSLIIAKLFCRQ